MSNMRLCGGTFLVLLFQAIGERRNARITKGRSSEGKSEPEVFERLVITVIPAFKKPDGNSFNVFTSGYKLCKKRDASSVNLTENWRVEQFDTAVKAEYSTKIKIFVELMGECIDFNEKGKWLVAALLDLIEADDNIPEDALFYVMPDGNAVKKADLWNIERICVPSFILGVWHYIVTQVSDNTVGEETIDRLLDKNTASYNQRKFISNIGYKTAMEIKVYGSLPEGVECSAQAKTNTSTELNSETSTKSQRFVLPDEVLYKSSMYDEDVLRNDECIKFVDLNETPEQFSLKKSSKTIYMYQTSCSFKSIYIPHEARQIQVSINVKDIELQGHTSSENWKSRSLMDRTVRARRNQHMVWFYVASDDPQSYFIQYLIIGNKNV